MFKFLGPSWRTTLGGWCAILTAIAMIAKPLLDNDPTTMPDWNTLLLALGLGGSGGVIGLAARDNGVTSEDAGIKK